MPRPNPRLAPVTRATLSATLTMMTFLCDVFTKFDTECRANSSVPNR